MTRSEALQICKRMDVIFDEDHPDHIDSGKIQRLEPPFMEYTLTDAAVHADGIRYLDIKRFTITLYSDTEESPAEENIESVLVEEELRWRKNREFEEELLMWMITYTLEV